MEGAATPRAGDDMVCAHGESAKNCESSMSFHSLTSLSSQKGLANAKKSRTLLKLKVKIQVPSRNHKPDPIQPSRQLPEQPQGGRDSAARLHQDLHPRQEEADGFFELVIVG